jgi:hypothetical protein
MSVKGTMVDLIAPVLAILGIAAGSGGTYLIARFNRRGEMIDAQRKAYANWFTSVELTRDRLTTILRTSVGSPTDTKGYAAFAAEIAALSEDIHGLLTALNETYFQEPDADLRDNLMTIKRLLLTVAGYLETIGRHYYAAMHVSRSIDHIIAEETIPDEKIKLLKEKLFAEDIGQYLQSARNDLQPTVNHLDDAIQGLRTVLALRLSGR